MAYKVHGDPVGELAAWLGLASPRARGWGGGGSHADFPMCTCGRVYMATYNFVGA